MKYLAVLLLFAIPAVSSAACNNKVDSSKVVLFVDTNYSDMEITSAEKAACSRGETLVVVPKNYKDYSKVSADLHTINERVNACSKAGNFDKCKPDMEKQAELHHKLQDLKKTNPTIKDSLKATLQELKNSNKKIQSLVISGHDGGGQFGGNKGNFSRRDLQQMMEDLEGINDIKSLLLLGCYTGVQKEIIDWKKIFPNVRLIGGFDGSGPLSVRPEGHKYISDLLTKEKNIIKQSDEKKLKDFAAKNISSMFNLYSGVYVQCEDPEKTEYYYGSKTPEKSFSKMDLKICADKETIKEIATALAEYDSGAKEVPKNTSNGELRQLYNKARAREHCFDQFSGINVNKIFNLLFYEGVKNSFAHHYQSDLKKVESELKDLTMDEIKKNLEKILADLEEKIAKDKAEIELQEKNPNEYMAKQKEQFEKLKKELETLKSSPAYAFMAELRTPEQWQGVMSDFAITEKLKKFYDLQNAVQMKKWAIDSEAANPTGSLQMKKSMLESSKKSLAEMQTTQTQIMSDPNFVKGIWIPTKENLAKKTRKETLDNIHKISSLLSSGVLPPKQSSNLMWVTNVSSSHLSYFQNPFSWHEYNGVTVEKPQIDIPLTGRSGFYGGNGAGYGSGFGVYSNGGGISVGGVPINPAASGYVGGAASGR